MLRRQDEYQIWRAVGRVPQFMPILLIEPIACIDWDEPD